MCETQNHVSDASGPKPQIRGWRWLTVSLVGCAQAGVGAYMIAGLGGCLIVTGVAAFAISLLAQIESAIRGEP